MTTRRGSSKPPRAGSRSAQTTSEDTPAAARRALAVRLDGARSRGAVKTFGREVDADPTLRAQVEALAVERGIDVDPRWSGKKLVRAARDREAESRVRTNPIRRDQAFVCLHCQAEVPAGGGHVRDHCPRCLRSRHVDRIPGDRAADCGGLFDPQAFERSHGHVVIVYRCRLCGADWRGRAHDDDQIPPDFNVASLPGPVLGESTSSALATVQRRARTLPLRVLDAIRRQRLWAPGDSVLVAVSGGLDSTVLLEILVELAGGHGGRLAVASVDHGLRPESAQEVAAVGRRARELGLPFHGRSVGLEPGPNLAARARAARWSALEDIEHHVIATAHHRDDQAETVLQHLLRGSGMRGLRGMLPRAGHRVRPLLSEPRAVLQRWAEDRGLHWVEDPSNAASERGQLRQILPELHAVRAGAVGGLARSARLLAREDAFLTQLTDTLWEELSNAGTLPLDAWGQQPPALQLRLLRRLVAPIPFGSSVRADQLERLLDAELAEGVRHGLPGGYSIAVQAGALVLLFPPEG